MSYETRAYDNVFGEPIVVLVVTGTHDVSRLVNTLTGAPPVCEQISVGQQVLRQVRRHNGGRAALKLLAQHGGPDLLETVTPTPLAPQIPARVAVTISDSGCPGGHHTPRETT